MFGKKRKRATSDTQPRDDEARDDEASDGPADEPDSSTVSVPADSGVKATARTSRPSLPDAFEEPVESGTHSVPDESRPSREPLRLSGSALDPAHVSAALDGGPPIERFATDFDDDAPFIEEEDTHLGTVIADRYVVDAVIGEGGMGRVYLARHSVIDKKVAVKVLHAGLARDHEAVGRFVREAKAASSIGNPHIVDISDFGEVAGSTFFVMEYLDGLTLAELIDMEGHLAPDEIADIGGQICDGLAAAHDQDIIHRDLKPDNIVLVERAGKTRFAKILDFGIAKVSGPSGHTKLTVAGAVFGTPQYMSPEQAAGTAVDHRADVYSLGILLYEMASGELPFNADNFMGILTQHMYKAPKAVRELPEGKDCPPELEAIILKCLAKRPDSRYATMRELQDDLERFTRGEEPIAVTEGASASSRFQVPAEFLHSTTAPGVEAPATPDAPARSLLPRIMLGTLLGVGLGTAAFVWSQDPVPEASTTSAVVEASPAPTPDVTSTSAPDTPSPTPSDDVHSVLVHSPAVGAIALIDGEELTLPANVVIPDGRMVRVRVSAPGHRPELLELDGGQAKVEVKLARVGGGGRPPAKKASPLPKKVDGVVEPWD